MKIEIDLLDAFLLSKEDGTSAQARVAQVRWQKAPRASWQKVNIVVESPSPATALAAAAAWFEQQAQQ